MHHESALEVGGYAGQAAQGDEEQRHLSAVAVTVLQYIHRYAGDGGVLACRSPGEVVVDIGEDALGPLGWILYAACQTVGQSTQFGCECNVRQPLGGVFPVEGSLGVVWADGVKGELLSTAHVFKGFGEDCGLSLHCLLFHVDGAVGLVGSRHLVLGRRSGKQLDVRLAGNLTVWEGQPAAYLLALGHHIGRHGEGICHPHVPGLGGVVGRVGSIAQDLREVLHVGQLAGGIALAGMCLLPYLPALGVYAEQVTPGCMEVHLLSVQLHALQCARCFPPGHLLIGDSWDEAADIVHHLLAALCEVAEQPVVEVIFPTVFLCHTLHGAQQAWNQQGCSQVR